MDEKALVFVSCGQATAAEKKLGKNLIALVERAPGLQAYFAETVNSLEGLSANIFRNLERASAFVTVMHRRGIVKGHHRAKDRIRASVWIEQEIAIASFIQQTRSPNLRVAAYTQKGIAREGVRDTIILNAFKFESDDEILADLESRLAEWDLSPRRSDAPSVAVQLHGKDRHINAARHVYQLEMTLTNTSSVTIPQIEWELEFPRAFVPPNRQFHPHEERSDQATKTHRFFRGGQKIDLRPSKEASVSMIFEYLVTDDLFSEYHGKMKDLPVTVEVFADGRSIGTASRPFEAMQHF